MLTEADFVNLSASADDGFSLSVRGSKGGQPGEYSVKRSKTGKPVKFQFRPDTTDGSKAAEAIRELSPGEIASFVKPMAKFAGLSTFNGVTID